MNGRMIVAIEFHRRSWRHVWHRTGERSGRRASRVEHREGGDDQSNKSTAADHDSPFAS